MDHESSCENTSDIDSKINDSFQSIMSISEVSEIDQNNVSFQSIMSISEVSEIDQNINDFEDILPESELDADTEESEIKVNTSYPNEAYADLMLLITKYKLNNATGNAIIKFFNKHANLSISPLPKSIEKGRKHMDNMNMPNLTYDKTCIIKYNNEEYYLHHRPLINCVKNIMSTSDISQNFALNFEKVKVIIYTFFIQFMQLNIVCYLN